MIHNIKKNYHSHLYAFFKITFISSTSGTLGLQGEHWSSNARRQISSIWLFHSFSSIPSSLNDIGKPISKPRLINLPNKYI